MPVSMLVVLAAGVFVVGFVLTIGLTLTGMWRHRRLFDQVLDAAGQTLNQLADEGKAKESALVACSYCGNSVPAGARCPSCGAAE